MMTTLLEIDLQELWKKRALTVLQAESVQKGIQTVKTNKPGFAVVDLRLADGNGLKLLKKYKFQIPQVELLC